MDKVFYMKTKAFEVGSKIKWKYIGYIIDGTVEEVFMGPVEKEIKGKKIKRNGSVEKPAYLVKSEAGNYCFKASH